MVEVRILPHEATDEDRITVEVIYSKSEWQQLEDLYKKLKCKEKVRENVRMYDECEVDFGNIAWQLRHAIQFRSRNYTIDVYDDPSLHSFIDYTSVNIAIFRFIPTCDFRNCTARMTFNSTLIYSKILDVLPRIFNNYVDLLELLTVKTIRIVVEVVT
jgi:hypothetical protein